ncbi:MAG: uroporphyrinogen-III decarboxylase-like protein [Lentisphaerae bacterium GWF2_44_16]|nr:MAG: uroporphyrinogen-III decarboxylase-like protein [Lentisphaerae bacterium GWF2_44_16]
MTKREVVRMVLEGKKAPYVPWNMGFTVEAANKLKEHFGKEDLSDELQNHIMGIGGTCFFEGIGNGCYRDVFGVIWDRSEDKDIGVVKNRVLPEASLAGFSLPDPGNPIFFKNAAEEIEKRGDCFRIFAIGFSLFERAWTLRGMENLLMDFYENPQFVKDLFRKIADFNISVIERALEYDIDEIHFGDDWGQQRGLIMGPAIWREFIYPELKRMYGVARDAGKFVSIHSCGDVDELFDDLVGIGLQCFNPFQPEVMDVESLMKKYRGKLTFYGGLSTQRTLPYGTVEDVKKESSRLIELGRNGNYIFAPAHAVEGDVPLENMLAFIDVVQNQKGFHR